MTSYFPFVKPTLGAASPFVFQPSLDLQPANVSIPWSLFGRRWYFQLSDTNGVLIVLRAAVGSPDGTLNKSIKSYPGCVIVETIKPHGYEFMATVNLTISGALPVELNGLRSCFITGPTTYRFSTMESFTTITAYGQTDYNIDLIEGYVSGSTLVFRDSTKSFEVSP